MTSYLPEWPQVTGDAAGQQFLLIEPDPFDEAPQSAEAIHIITDSAVPQRE